MIWFKQGELILKTEDFSLINKVSSRFKMKLRIQTIFKRKLRVTAVMIADGALSEIQTDGVEV